MHVCRLDFGHDLPPLRRQRGGWILAEMERKQNYRERLWEKQLKGHPPPFFKSKGEKLHCTHAKERACTETKKKTCHEKRAVVACRLLGAEKKAFLKLYDRRAAREHSLTHTHKRRGALQPHLLAR